MSPPFRQPGEPPFYFTRDEGIKLLKGAEDATDLKEIVSDPKDGLVVKMARVEARLPKQRRPARDHAINSTIATAAALLILKLLGLSSPASANTDPKPTTANGKP